MSFRSKNFTRIILMLFLFSSQFSNAQLTEKKFHISGKYLVGAIDSSVYQGAGLSMEWHVHRNIGLIYSVDYFQRDNNYRHFHAPMGIIGGPFLILTSFANSSDDEDESSSSGFGALIGVLILALPDGVSAHFSPAYKWDISPYANVLGIDFVKDRTTNNSWIKYSCSFGTRVHYSLSDHVIINSFIETRKVAGHAWGIGGGLGIGYAFVDREE